MARTALVEKKTKKTKTSSKLKELETMMEKMAEQQAELVAKLEEASSVIQKKSAEIVTLKTAAAEVPAQPLQSRLNKAQAGPMRFRVVHGRHYEYDPTRKSQVCYRTGDVFESFRHMDKLFANKFIQADETSKVSHGTWMDPLVEAGRPGDEDEDGDVFEGAQPEEEAGEEVVEGHYEMRHAGGSRWRVVPCNVEGEVVGKPVHDGFLNRSQALEMLASLDTEDEE